MRVVIQRVKHASVSIEGKIKASISEGLMLLLGFEYGDNDEDIKWLSHKIIRLRIFNDTAKIPNLSVQDIKGDILLISQFTLFASTKKGNRPSYSKAAKTDIAFDLYEQMIQQLETDLDKKIETGIFGADMQVNLLNDGPVTILMDTKNK